MLVKRRLLPHGMSEESQRKANGVELAERMTLNESFIEHFQQRYSPHILKILLTDRTTGKNIIWADNEYESLGEGYQSDDEITIEKNPHHQTTRRQRSRATDPTHQKPRRSIHTIMAMQPDEQRR